MTGLLPCFILAYNLADIVLNVKIWCLVNLELSEQTFLEDKRLKDMHIVREKFCSHMIRDMLILTMLQNTLALKCYVHVLYRYCAKTYLGGLHDLLSPQAWICLNFPLWMHLIRRWSVDVFLLQKNKNDLSKYMQRYCDSRDSSLHLQ